MHVEFAPFASLRAWSRPFKKGKENDQICLKNRVNAEFKIIYTPGFGALIIAYVALTKKIEVCIIS